jgi:hypothetical protein
LGGNPQQAAVVRQPRFHLPSARSAQITLYYFIAPGEGRRPFVAGMDFAIKARYLRLSVEHALNADGVTKEYEQNLTALAAMDRPRRAARRPLADPMRS